MTHPVYSVVNTSDQGRYLVVRVAAGYSNMRPLPVIVAAGPFPTAEAAQAKADELHEVNA